MSYFYFIIEYIKNKINNFTLKYYGYETQSKKKGDLSIISFSPYPFNYKNIKTTIIYSLKSFIMTSSRRLNNELQSYDSFSITFLVLISFSTKQGFKVNEKFLSSSVYVDNFNNIDFKFLAEEAIKNIVKLEEKYDVDDIYKIVIKIL